MNVGKAIQTLRKEKKITQVELSERANISQAALSQIENGKRPGAKTMTKICAAMNVPEALVYVKVLKEDETMKSRILYKELFPVIEILLLRLCT